MFVTLGTYKYLLLKKFDNVAKLSRLSFAVVIFNDDDEDDDVYFRFKIGVVIFDVGSISISWLSLCEVVILISVIRTWRLVGGVNGGK